MNAIQYAIALVQREQGDALAMMGACPDGTLEEKLAWMRARQAAKIPPGRRPRGRPRLSVSARPANAEGRS